MSLFSNELSTNKKLIEEAKKDIESDLTKLKLLQSKVKPEDSILETESENIETESSEDNIQNLIQLYDVLNSNDDENDENASEKSESCKLIEKSLNNIILKIDIKKRLIDELETNTKNLEQMRIQYEEKMSMLHERIKQIEDERDKVILNMSNLHFFF